MKDTIYTIPLTDAFEANDECPFCFIKRKLEQDAISFILGCAYMEDDFRMQTDILGFCPDHSKKMYDYGNRLGMALMLHTHYIALQKELTEKINSFTPASPSFMSKFKKVKSIEDTPTNVLSSWAKEKEHSCYICDSISNNFVRYMDTFFYLYSTNPEFKELFKASKGFCVPHFGDLIRLSEHKIPAKEKEDFYKLLFDMMNVNLKRIEEDISWFIEKYDYENKNADWKNSKDAVIRGIQKLSSIYVQDPPFKESK